MVSSTARPRSFLRLRGKSFMSVVLTPELPLEGWIGELDEQVARSPKVFEGRPVLLDVSLLVGEETSIPGLVQSLGERRIRVIGIDGTMPHMLGSMADSLPPVMAGGRNAALLGDNEPKGEPRGGRRRSRRTAAPGRACLIDRRAIGPLRPEHHPHPG